MSENGAAHPIKPAAIFWDMDGTLTNSEPIWGEATYRMSELMGKRLTPELRAKTVGGTFLNTFSIAAAHAGYTPKPGDVDYFREQMLNHVRQAFARESAVFPGVRSLLAALKEDGIPMLVTTNTQRDVAQPVIDDIGNNFFVDTICGDEVNAGKPNPEMYLEAARRVGAQPGVCLVFEDSTTGMQAAAKAGCVTIGLPADEDTVVPDGVVPIGDIHSGNHLEEVRKDDIYRWFKQLRRGA